MQEKVLRAAIVNAEGKVLNVVAYCPVRSKSWSPPQGTILVFHDKVDIGDFWDAEKKEIQKPCQDPKCKDESHRTDRPHPSITYPAQKGN